MIIIYTAIPVPHVCHDATFNQKLHKSMDLVVVPTLILQVQYLVVNCL